MDRDGIQQVVDQIAAQKARWRELRAKLQPLREATFLVPRDHLERLERIPSEDERPPTPHAIRA